MLAGSPASSLSGGFRASLEFGADVTGYFLHPGVIELGFGAFELSATGFDVIKGNSVCADGAPLLATDTITFAPSPSSRSDGFLDMFTQRFSIDLATQPTFRSMRRPDCATALPLTPTNLMTGLGDPPVPLHLDGEFRVSPGFTADGYLRFGTLTATGTQDTPFAYLHTCTAAQSGPTATCDGQADEVVYPMRTSTVAFTAEILLGKVPVRAP